nr:hypothetical protein [uncultured Capnocytophaga sp.]
MPRTTSQLTIGNGSTNLLNYHLYLNCNIHNKTAFFLHFPQ